MIRNVCLQRPSGGVILYACSGIPQAKLSRQSQIWFRSVNYPDLNQPQPRLVLLGLSPVAKLTHSAASHLPLASST